MITRRSILVAGGFGLLVAYQQVGAQPVVSLRRVGWLSMLGESSVASLYAAFEQGMRELGWHEGRNYEYRFVYAHGIPDRLDALVLELIALNVDVIIVGNGPATRAAQRATKTIPIVMASVGDPVRNGFVSNLARPGGNTTGVTSQAEQVFGKLIEILHEMAPTAMRIAIVLDENSPAHPMFWATAQQACSALNIVALRVVASSAAQFGHAVEQILRQRAQAVVVMPDPLYLNEVGTLQALLEPMRLPVAYGWREHVVAGGLLSYATDLPAVFRDAAKYVDKIFKGTKPADLPVEQATKFELVINAKTANALGITVPQSLLLRADEVIQ